MLSQTHKDYIFSSIMWYKNAISIKYGITVDR